VGYRTIVAATDGSETATTALEAAARFAKRCRAQLLIVSAYEPPGTTATQARAIVDEARAHVAELGVDAAASTQLGQAAETIIDLAARSNADAVVMGNVGMGRARRFTLGSVPDRVAHHAPCDVLIVDTTHERDREAGYKKLLVGTDGSPTANEAARKAFELALMLRASVTLVTVGDPLLGAITLEETEAGKLGKTEVERRLLSGSPVEAILELLDQEPHDLVLVGNKGMAGARRYLLGSVPNRLAHAAPTDVLIAKTVGRTVDDLAPGHGGVVDHGGQKVAAYRDEEGGLHVMSPRCTHMGCIVDWNDTERTWDCPCHGSRYAWNGEVIEGPAVKGLARQ